MISDNIIPLVLSLARVEPSVEILQKAGRIMEGKIDWQELYRFSFVHGVAPLLYRNLRSFSGVPPEVLQNFRQVYLFNIKDTVTAANELREIIAFLTDGGVESIPIKGVTVAEEVFGDASLYASSDIDILISSKDIYLAADIIRKKGYSLADAEIDPLYPDYYEDLHFSREGRKTVEVHFRLGQKRYFTIPENFWWEDVREKTFTGPCTYTVLSIERNLLYQSLHLFSHGYSPLKFIVVISEILRVFRDDIKWEKLTEEARRYRAERPLLLSVYLATRLLDAPVPYFVCALLENLSPKERWIFQRVERNVFSSGARYSYIMFLLTILQYDFFEVMGRMMKWIFPSLSEIRYRYDLPKNSRAVYLYYLLNPVLLLLKKRNL